MTLHACLDAADQLKADGISARVIDVYSVKPIDTDTLAAAAAATGGKLVVAEDHHPEGGLGSAVVDALTGAGRADLTVRHLAVAELPGSGTSEELLDAARYQRRPHRGRCSGYGALDARIFRQSV